MFATDQRLGLRSSVARLRGAVDQLTSALRGFAPADEPVGGDELERVFGELTALGKALEVTRLGLLARIDRERTWAADGHTSSTSWVASRFGETGPVAAAEVNTARALEQMPKTKAAFAAGDVGRSAVRMLVQAHRVAPESFGAAEERLVDAARVQPARELERTLASWTEQTDADAARRDAEHAYRRRNLHLSTTLAGMVRVTGELDRPAGEAFITAIAAEVDRQVRAADPADTRTPEQRRADALSEITDSYLRRRDRPTVAGERPHVSIVVDLETLKGRPGRADAEHTGRMPAEAVRLLTCDAIISRIVMAGRSVPLDVGRRTPVISPALRRALIARDKSCAFKSCGRRAAWCDAHHIRHWADGGATSLENLVLLCRFHHRLVHDGRWCIVMVDSLPVAWNHDWGEFKVEARP